MIESLPEGEFGKLRESANAALVNLGITFNGGRSQLGGRRPPRRIEGLLLEAGQPTSVPA